MFSRTSLAQSVVAATIISGGLFAFSASTNAAAIGVDWISSSSGDLNGISVTASSFPS